MPKTMTQKIIGEHAGRDVVPGEFVVAAVDWAYVQDGTGPLTVRQVEKFGVEQLPRPERCIIFIDHAAPSPRRELSNDHITLRQFAAKTGAVLSEIGSGVCHVLATEDYISPGELAVGADSHSCTGGALGAFTTGMGSTDVAVAFAFAKTWLRVPETWKVIVRGKFPKGVYSKDFMLHLIGTIGAEGANYKSLEFTGETVAAMTMEDRLTIANIVVECGAKAGLFPSDDTTRAFLEARGRGSRYRPLAANPDAAYERTLEFDVSSLEPTIACPHQPDNTKTIGELGDVAVNQVLIGTCTNGRLVDLHIAAGILKGRKVKPGVRLLVTPGSRRILREAVADGTVATLLDAGAVITAPGCGACVGVHDGIPGDGEAVLSTQNRNFEGRMGNPKAFIYLASPAVAAATAIEGRIADPREYL
ncbi:MAG: 3-isopropylmalate dehydratase large subunit [Planctomycetes bacterium]|nr:3-isopropylmalate dehydratase large subunit [Planctomycetota bacterium]